MERKLTIPEVLPQIREYYQNGECMATFHLVLDDGNIKDGDIQDCIDTAREYGDEEGVKIGELLLKLSKTQRSKICSLL